MNADDEAKVDCIQAQADKLIQDSSPELLGAVGLPQFMLYAQRGFHLKRGAMAECGLKETLARGPPPCFSCGCITLSCLTLQY